jgi:hypothetical protein
VNSKLKIFRIIAVLVLCITTCDVVYSAVSDNSGLQNTFLCKSEMEDSSEDIFEDIIPEWEPTISLLLKSEEENTHPSVIRPLQKANITPHGLSVPVFLDDCVFRL